MGYLAYIIGVYKSFDRKSLSDPVIDGKII
jgi:hypothetical protein